MNYFNGRGSFEGDKSTDDSKLAPKYEFSVEAGKAFLKPSLPAFLSLLLQLWY